MAEQIEQESSCRKILIAVDDSAHSEKAFDFFMENVYKDGDYVVVAHVSELHPPALPHALATEDWKHEVEKHERKINDLKTKYKDLCDARKLHGKILVEGAGSSGVGHHVILAAKKEGVHFIVCATRGMGAIRRTILVGKMTELPEGCKRVIMVCLDDSIFSEEAFNYFYNNVYRQTDYILAAHISALRPPAWPGAIATPEWRDEVQKHEVKVRQLEEKWKDKLSELEITARNGRILVASEHYSIGETICKTAKGNHVSMIVCGQRGLGRIRRTILGSTSDYLLHHAHCPVLVVPKHHGDKECHLHSNKQQEMR